MTKYRRIPEGEIEAVRLLRTRKSIKECLEFIGVRTDPPVPARCFPKGIEVPTPGGRVLAPYGSYIIKHADGQYYPCSASIFKNVYEEVKDEQ